MTHPISRIALFSLVLAACGGTVGVTPPTADAAPDAMDASALPDTASTLDSTTPADSGSDVVLSLDSGAADSESDAVAEASCSPDPSTDPHNCGWCGHDCRGAACTGGLCAPVVVVQAKQPHGIALDSQYVFWADQGYYGIMRADLDGSNVTTLTTDFSTVAFPTDLVVYGDDVYWDNFGSSSAPLAAVGRCPKSGCQGSSVALPYAGPFSYGTGVAVSDAGVFWSTLAITAGVWPAIWRIDETEGGTSGPIVTDLFVGGPLQLDGDQLYFGARALNPGSMVVGRIGAASPLLPLDAGASSFDVLDQLADTYPLAPSIFEDGTTVFFDDPYAGTLGSVPKDGLADAGVAQTLAMHLQGPGQIVADATDLYFTLTGPDQSESGTHLFDDGAIVTCPKAGCPASGPLVLATGLHGVSGYLALDADYVWFTVGGDFNANDGTVMKVAR